MRKHKRGFIALVSVLIISAVLLGLSLGANQSSLLARFNGMDGEYSVIARTAAEACLHTALLSLAENYNYAMAGGVTMQVGQATCILQSITTLTATPNQKLVSIQTSGTYNHAFVRLTAEIVVQNNTPSNPSLPTVAPAVSVLYIDI